MNVSSSEPSTSTSIQANNPSKNYEPEDDSPFNDGCFCFAKKKQSTFFFSAFKCFLCIICSLAFIYEMTLCTLFVKHYLDVIQDLRDTNIWPARTTIQVESANGHFFLINAIILGPIIVVALAGVIRERLIIRPSFSYAYTVTTGFQLIGAWQ